MYPEIWGAGAVFCAFCVFSQSAFQEYNTYPNQLRLGIIPKNTHRVPLCPLLLVRHRAELARRMNLDPHIPTDIGCLPSNLGLVYITYHLTARDLQTSRNLDPEISTSFLFAMQIQTISLFCAGFVPLAMAQVPAVRSAPASTTVDMFLGAKRHGNYSFVGSVISVIDTTTVYEVICESGALNLPGFPTTTCDPAKDPVQTPIKTFKNDREADSPLHLSLGLLRKVHLP